MLKRERLEPNYDDIFLKSDNIILLYYIQPSLLRMYVEAYETLSH